MFDPRTLFIGFTLLIVSFVTAYMMGIATTAQMRTTFPGKSILPMVWHGGYLFNFPMTFWLALLVRRHEQNWTVASWSGSALLSLIATYFIFKYGYTMGTAYETFVRPSGIPNVRGQVTTPGWIYAAYFAFAIAIFLQCYFPWTNPGWSPTEMWWTTAVIIVLLAVGNHFVLGALTIMGYCKDYKEQPLTSIIGWATVIGVGAPVAIVSWLRSR